MSLVDCAPQNCVRVFDGMCIVQHLQSGCLSDFMLPIWLPIGFYTDPDYP